MGKTAYIIYNDEVIGEVEEGKLATLSCKGKIMKDDIFISYGKETTFTMNGCNYKADIGMTFEEFQKSDYYGKRLILPTQEGIFITEGNVGAPLYLGGVLVKKQDRIRPNKNYEYESEYGNLSNFYVHDTSLVTGQGLTWQEWASTNYSTNEWFVYNGDILFFDEENFNYRYIEINGTPAVASDVIVANGNYSIGDINLTISDLEYVLSESGNVYNCAGIRNVAGTEIIVLAEKDGLPINKILASAFENNEKVKNLTAELGLSIVEKRAFYNCLNLESIKFSWLPNVGSLSFREEVFYNCQSLTDVDFSDVSGGLILGDRCFANCYSLNEITIPKGTYLYGYVFENCTSLQTAIFEEGFYKAIPAYTFNNCTSLTRVVIPKTVTYFEDAVFYGCSQLKRIEFTGTMSEWSSLIKPSGLFNGSAVIEIVCENGVITL